MARNAKLWGQILAEVLLMRFHVATGDLRATELPRWLIPKDLIWLLGAHGCLCPECREYAEALARLWGCQVVCAFPP